MSCLRAAIAAASLAALAALPAGAADLTLEIDHAQAVRLSEPASAVIVGNPLIADVTPHDAGLFLVTGKSFGETNVIALDAEGQQIYEANIQVVGASSNRLTLHRGLGRESYACFGSCERIPVPGDSQAAFDQTLDSQVKAIEAANSAAQTN
jgi:Flp pilus assembly secretin CpaC